MNRLTDAYGRLLDAGELRPDADQRVAVTRLAVLLDELEKVPAPSGLFGRLFGGKPSQPQPRGVYLWGGVGRGKSMLMDLFFDALAITEKRRVHFHAFMIEVHQQMRKARSDGLGDPIASVAKALTRDVRLLAFDEMVVNNSADAMILSRLFTAMMAGGLTIVITSNRPPADLYKDGLNREHFLPFIDLIARDLDVLPLNGPTDYRRQRLGVHKLWWTPNGDAATRALSAAFFSLTDYPVEDREHVPSCTLDVGGGRTLHVPKALKGVAVFSFKRLCAEPRGSSDYLAIARTFHTVIIVGIPQLSPEKRNEAARFVTLVDALYEYKVKLLAAADAEPDRLYVAGDGVFEFERTVSRLTEMQSDAYLDLPHGTHE